MHDQRRFSIRLTMAILLALVWAPGASTGADGRRPITETDLFRFVWIADPQISPDGGQIVFVRVSVNDKKDGYDTALWIVPTDRSEPPRPFTRGPRDLSPRWSADGKRLAFLRAVEKDGKTQPPQIHLISTEGGEARSLTDLPKGAGAPAWSPDGKTIAFTSTTTDEDLAKKKKELDKKTEGERKDAGKKEGEQAEGEKKEGDKKETEKSDQTERESDVRVITRAVYRFNGPGYLDARRRSHVWTLEVPAGSAEAPAPKRITSGEFDEQNPAWSPDGSRIFFTSTRVKEPYYQAPDTDLYSVPATGGEVTKVASIDGGIGDFSLDREGKRIAFEGVSNTQPPRSFNQPDLFLAEGSSGAPRNLTATYDFDVGSGITGDQHAPRGSQPSAPTWSRDGRSIIVKVGERGRANLKRVDAASGKVEALTNGDQEVVAYTASADASRLGVLVSTPTHIGDIFVVSADDGKMTQLTRINETLLAELDLPAPEEITYTSFDGKKIQAWIQKPPGFDAATKYPFILNIHGGPHAAYGYTFFHEFHWMAAKGYVVLYPNPRGSSAYGQDFGNVIQYRYPGDDFKDLMAGVDEVLRRGYVDPKRLGVTGGSGGGILTNWAITQTDRFAAAVAQRSIADWTSFWYTADFTLFRPTWFKASPWQDPVDFAARSPITHVAKVKTPLMLVEGEADYRTPPTAGGEQMFRALKYLRKPVVMVRFPEESHDLSRSGKPWHRVERLQHILNWFDKYLQGKKVDAYDVP